MLSTGWLSPTGEFLECELFDHISLSKEIAKSYKHYLSEMEPSTFIENQGWIGIHISLFGKKEWIVSSNKMTEDQYQFLRKYLQDEIPVSLGFKIAMEIYEDGY